MEQRLTSLLNTCKSGNFPAADQCELSSLIPDYFVSNGPDPEWSDDEGLSEPDNEIHSLSLRILHQARLSINNSQEKSPTPTPTLPSCPPFSLNVNHFALTEYYMFSFLH